MNPNELRLARNTALTVLALVAMRLIAAAYTPLTFDEAYYWTWSRYLATGYYDHPPMVAYVIRIGTMLAGDTELGVRVFSILLALPMSWAVYRTAQILYGGQRIAATATILLNVTMMASVGTMIVTPDAPLLVASAFVLFFLAKVAETGQGAWWLAVGVAVGVAMQSKYTAFFFGPSILIWLIAAPRMRRWLISPWPYLGGIVAGLVFLPVVLWNADHQWVSFIKQLGRARIDSYSWRFIGELVPTQFGLATPLIFVLGMMGLFALFRPRAGATTARVLISAMFWVIVVYFAWHSLHSRVEANWFGPVYPSFAIAAAVAAHVVRWEKRSQRLVNFCVRWGPPLGIVMFAALVVQANTGWLSGYRRDATVRSVGLGWRAMGAEIEAVRVRTGANCVLAPDYGTTSWLMFYLPKTTCVAQFIQRYRWSNMPQPTADQLQGKLLFIDDVRSKSASTILKGRFEKIEKAGEFARSRGPLVFETDEALLLEGPLVDVLDQFPPPELQGTR